MYFKKFINGNNRHSTGQMTTVFSVRTSWSVRIRAGGKPIGQK
jgi:hypothetical protein